MHGQQEWVYSGALERLADLVSARVLLFIQEGNLRRFGARIMPLLRHTELTLYTAITPNPRRDDLDPALQVLRPGCFDFMVACGGGSVIDFAKACCLYAMQRHGAERVPMVAIPTTAGSGSEATQFAVIYVDGVKQSLDDPVLLPDAAICDSTLSAPAPRYLKACAAMDAYCQAIESFWSRRATACSKQTALEAAALCASYLPDAVNSCDQLACEMMMKASHLAGQAINISRTTAAHALSYTMTAAFGIPHGHAVALNIGALFEHNLRAVSDAEELLRVMGLAGVSPGGIQEYFSALMRRIGLETELGRLGLAAQECELIVSSVNPQRLANNPRSMTRGELLDVLHRRIKDQ